jgi:hypothetical protein
MVLWRDGFSYVLWVYEYKECMSGQVEGCVHGHKYKGSVVRCKELTYTSAYKLQVNGMIVIFMFVVLCQFH